MQAQLEAMELGPLLGIFLQSFFVQFTMTALNIVIFVIVYGRMIEIYLMTSLAPIPFAHQRKPGGGPHGPQLFQIPVRHRLSGDAHYGVHGDLRRVGAEYRYKWRYDGCYLGMCSYTVLLVFVSS